MITTMVISIPLILAIYLFIGVVIAGFCIGVNALSPFGETDVTIIIWLWPLIMVLTVFGILPAIAKSIGKRIREKRELSEKA